MTVRYKTIDKWYEPADMLRAKEGFQCEMDREDHGFLCGMIKKIRPCKIVEIGVAEGGTTSVIINALSMCGNEACEVVSVDLNEKLYVDSQRQTGYQYEMMRKYIDLSHCSIQHTFMLGEPISERIEEIGGGIDLVIIDTTHRLPGEILDFLCVLPYMKEDGGVVLHDVNLNYRRSFDARFYEGSGQRIATKVLLAAVSGCKYLEAAAGTYANIGAVEVNEQTRENIEDLFMILSATWDYKVSKRMLSSYREIYARHYSEICLELFDASVKSNETIWKNTEFNRLKERLRSIAVGIPYNDIPYGSRIAVYGSGERADSLMLLALVTEYFEVAVCVDDNWRELEKEKIQMPSALKQTEFDFLIITDQNRLSWQQKKNYIISEKIASAEQILAVTSEFEIPTDGLKRYPYAFPYDQIPAGAKICLYGAGKCGKNVFKRVSQTKYCEIVGWVDKNHKNIPENMAVEPEAMKDMDFDYILIAIVDREVSREIKEQIIQAGWSHGKPVVQMP